MNNPFENKNPQDDLKQEQERFEKMDFYERLGVSKNATKQEITKAYKELVLKYHPDKQGGDTLIMQYISEAYQTIGDSSKRMRYDNDQAYSKREGHSNRSERKYEDEKAKEQKRQEDERARKEAEEMLRKQKINNLAKEAKKGPYEFKHFIDPLIKNGEEEDFFEIPEVFDVIKEGALNKATHGPVIYKDFVERWQKEAGLPRDFLNKDEDVIRVAKLNAQESGAMGPKSYEACVKDWAEVGVDVA